MNLKPAKLGAEPKKIAILGALLVVAGYFYLSNQSSNQGSPAPKNAATELLPAATSPRTPVRNVAKKTADRGPNVGPREFKPSLKAKDVDPSGVDPTLHLAELAKLQGVKPQADGRSLFDLGTVPPPDMAKIKEPEKIKPMVGPMPPPPPPPPPPEPRAPPIPLKFYGFVNQNKAGDKRAFFLDGEDIVIATEGDMIKKRYKIIRIGVNSAVVEDTQFKGTNTQQTLPLETEVMG